jgi:hypothetical protein
VHQCASVLRAIIKDGCEGCSGVAVVSSVDGHEDSSSSSSEHFTPSTAPPSSVIIATPQSIMSHFPTLSDVRQWSVVVGDEVM